MAKSNRENKEIDSTGIGVSSRNLFASSASPSVKVGIDEAKADLSDVLFNRMRKALAQIAAGPSSKSRLFVSAQP